MFLLLSLLKRLLSFDKISKLSNLILVAVGIFLLAYQLNGYFTEQTHHHQNHLQPQELKNEQHIKLDTNSYEHNHEHNDDHDHSHSH
jgi:ABC-type nickel/cobalt efflux system permease component RcnA